MSFATIAAATATRQNEDSRHGNIIDSSVNRDAPLFLGGSQSLPLAGSWSFWYLIRHGKGSVQAANYENSLHQIATVGTAEEFWSVYGHLQRPSRLPINSDYQLFRKGIKPVWEDSANATGGKWIVRLRKGLADRLWEHLLLVLVGGVFGETLGVCGAVLSVRYAEDILSVWNARAEDEEAQVALRETLKTVLCLPPNVTLEYKAHDTAMKDSSSFRNTEKIRP